MKGRVKNRTNHPLLTSPLKVEEFFDYIFSVLRFSLREDPEILYTHLEPDY